MQRPAENSDVIVDRAIANMPTNNSGNNTTVTSFCSDTNCVMKARMTSGPKGRSIPMTAIAPNMHMNSHNRGASAPQKLKMLRSRDVRRSSSPLPAPMFILIAAILCQLATSTTG